MLGASIEGSCEGILGGGDLRSPYFWGASGCIHTAVINDPHAFAEASSKELNTRPSLGSCSLYLAMSCHSCCAPSAAALLGTTQARQKYSAERTRQDARERVACWCGGGKVWKPSIDQARSTASRHEAKIIEGFSRELNA